MSDHKETNETKDIQPQQDDLDMAKIQVSMKGLREQQDKELQEDLEKFRNRPKPPWFEAQQEEQSPVAKDTRWSEWKMTNVPVAELPGPENIHGPEDFNHHITYEDAVQVTQRLEEIKPLIEQGYTGDDFSALDQSQGIDYLQGQQRIYELYYGSKAIKVAKDENGYHIDNGHHRIFIAKQLGINWLPVRLKEKL